MHSFADAYLSYGFAPMYAEADYELQMPMIRLEDPRGFYYENDRFGNTLRMAKCYKETVDKAGRAVPRVRAADPHEDRPVGATASVPGDEKVEVVQYCRRRPWVLFLPGPGQPGAGAVRQPEPSKCPCGWRSGPACSASNGGQFDQVVWVQLARHRMALLGLEAGVKAVGAPIAVPRDVSGAGRGPGRGDRDRVPGEGAPGRDRGAATRRSRCRRPWSQELRMGARYPEGRAGGIDASVITGRGVQALMGRFDTQISTAQTMIGDALAKVTGVRFELDCKVWPNMRKRITGNAHGEPYEMTYTPGKAIGDNYSCDVTYGFAAGCRPNAAVVMLLQLRGDGLIDRDTVRKNLPWAIDDEQMQRSLDVEQTADA
jgi:hypothetical protein